jgi:MraZ protein
MIFLSTYENKIDRKGRVSVPATFRATLEVNSQPLIVTKSLTSPCLEGQGSARIQQIVDVIDTMDALSEETRTLQALLSNAQEMKLDAEGRIMLPEEFLSFADLNETIIFAGVGRLFEMWNPASWREREAARRETIRTQGLPKLVLKPGGAPPDRPEPDREGS